MKRTESEKWMPSFATPRDINYIIGIAWIIWVVLMVVVLLGNRYEDPLLIMGPLALCSVLIALPIYLHLRKKAKRLSSFQFKRYRHDLQEAIGTFDAYLKEEDIEFSKKRYIAGGRGGGPVRWGEGRRWMSKYLEEPKVYFYYVLRDGPLNVMMIEPVPLYPEMITVEVGPIDDSNRLEAEKVQLQLDGMLLTTESS